MTPVSGISWPNFVNLAAFLHIKRALDIKHLLITKSSVFLGGQRHEVIKIGRTIVIFIHRYRWSMYSCDISDTLPGESKILDAHGGTVKSCQDIISIEIYLSSPEYLEEAAREFTRFGDSRPMEEAKSRPLGPCSPEQALEAIQQRLQLDPKFPELRQNSHFRNWSQVPFASRSSPSFPVAPPDLCNPLQTWDASELPFIGFPHELFAICDARGRVQMYMGQWNTSWGRPLYNAFTLWSNDIDPLEQRWMRRLPALPMSPYGLDRALENSEAQVFISDDCSRAKALNEASLRRSRSASVVSVAWPSGLPGTTARDIDWKPLMKRRIVCLVEEEEESVKRAAALSQALNEAGIDNVVFRFCHAK